jgi:hypothetical protein
LKVWIDFVSLLHHFDKELYCLREYFCTRISLNKSKKGFQQKTASTANRDGFGSFSGDIGSRKALQNLNLSKV